MDDSPVAFRFHTWYGSLDEGVGSVQMAPKWGVEILDNVVQKWPAGWPTSVVDEDVNGAQGFCSRCKRTRQTLRLFKVQHEGLVPSIAEASEFLAQGGQRSTVASADGDVGSGLGHHFRCCFTDAFAGPTNEGMLAFEGG